MVLIPIIVVMILPFLIAYLRNRMFLKKKGNILAMASESAILLKNISGDVYIESSLYTRWLFFDKTEVLFDKSNVYLLPRKGIFGQKLPGIVQISLDKNNRYINKFSSLHLLLFEIKSERKYIKFMTKETEMSTKKSEVILNFNNHSDKEVVLQYLSEWGFTLKSE